MYFIIISRFHPDFIQLTGILSNGGPGGVAPRLARGPPKAGLAASKPIKITIETIL